MPTAVANRSKHFLQTHKGKHAQKFACAGSNKLWNAEKQVAKATINAPASNPKVAAKGKSGGTTPKWLPKASGKSGCQRPAENRAAYLRAPQCPSASCATLCW